MKNYKHNSIVRTAITAVFLLSLSSYVFAQANPYLDPKNWVGAMNVSRQMVDNPSGVSQQGGALKLAGFHLGKEAQYSLNSELSKTLENKLVTLSINLNGEFVGADSSFLALVRLASSPKTIFWSQQCYAVLFKGTQIEVQKHGKGTNPNLVYKYSDFPALGFKTFPVNQLVKVTYGIVKDGPFPRMSVKLNGVEICNVLDNKYGQTVRPMPNNIFAVGVIATNKEAAGSVASASSLLISNFEVQ